MDVLSEEIVSRAILAPARDAGVLLCSTEKGVKIPYSSQDVADWMERISSQVVPYLRRLEKARSGILIASHNEYDIVDPDRFAALADYLRKAVDRR